MSHLLQQCLPLSTKKYFTLIKLMLNTFEAEKRCLDKHAQPQLIRCAYKRGECMPYDQWSLAILYPHTCQRSQTHPTLTNSAVSTEYMGRELNSHFLEELREKPNIKKCLTKASPESFLFAIKRSYMN